MKIICKSEIEMNSIKKSGDRLFYNPYLHQYFIIQKEKPKFNEDDWDENFNFRPEVFEDCLKMSGKYSCNNCEYIPKRGGKPIFCSLRRILQNQDSMEIK